ncbi:MAG TPA: LCP family protein [Nocardioidaceae bacterium]|nr:LCP family protein [Nocardioidaceae bacterium]
MPELAPADRVRFRRAVALLLMTLVLPGSAQLVAGRRRWGRVAVRVVGMLLFAAVVLVVVAKLWPTGVSALLFDPWVLALLRAGLVLLAVGWAALFVDAWRIGNPLALRQRQRLAVFSLNGVLCVAVSAALLFGAHLVGVQRSLVVDMFGSGTVSATDGGRYNVLLLGGDAGRSREGLRPDSITVASIDEDTGRTVLFGLPRNLEQVPFPDDTPMHEEFPYGFDCEGCYLNSVYTWATDAAQRDGDRFPDDVGDVGAYATKQAVEASTGLKINYYAMVDMRGFQDLVDAVGGVTVTVPERLPIGGVGGPVKGWIEAGRQHLDGHETLWFARSRATTDDYSRMARQKCVMGAMLSQLSPRTVLTQFQDIAEAGKQIVTTDIPAAELNTFLQLANKARRLPVSTVSFVPPKVETYDPDYDHIEEMVETAIGRAEAADERPRGGPAPVRARGGEPAAAAPAGDSDSADPHDANDTAALTGSC